MDTAFSAFSSSSKATHLANTSNVIRSSVYSLPIEVRRSSNISSDGNIPRFENETWRASLFTKSSPIDTASKAVLRSISSCEVNISSSGMYWTLKCDLTLLVLSIAFSNSVVGSASFSSGIGGSTYGS